MISTRRVTLRSRLRIRPAGSPNAVLARCMVRVSTRTPSCNKRAVGRIVHIRFYDRGVDAKSATVRDPGTLRDLDHLSMQLLDDLRAERARDLQDRLRVGHVAGIDAREHPIHQIGAHLALQVVVAPVEQMLQDQQADMSFPMWLRLDCPLAVGPGIDCNPWVSQDGFNWNYLGLRGAFLPVPSSGYVAGLAVTSHNTSELTTAHVGQLTLLPFNYRNDDIGSTGVASNAAYEVVPNQSQLFERFTIQAAGADVWGYDDSFAFVYLFSSLSRPAAQVLRYRVVSLEDTHPFAKAGLMWRESVAPGSKMVIAAMKPNGELEFMARPCSGCAVNYLGGAMVGFPAYIALTGNFSTFTAAVGSDPSSMKTVGSIDIPMSAAIPGFAVTSHDTTQLTTAVIDGAWLP